MTAASSTQPADMTAASSTQPAGITARAPGEPVVVDELVTETAHRLFNELCTHEAVQAAEDNGAAPEIWDAFCETGFDLIAIDEDAGGSGGTLADAAEVLRMVGYHAAPIPAAENGILGGWLLASAGLDRPDGLVTVIPPRAADGGWSGGGACSVDVAGDGSATVTGEALRVPWARSAEVIVCVCECDGQPVVVALPAAHCEITPLPNMAGEPRDTVRLNGAAGRAAPTPDGVDADSLAQRGALSRVALMAGAIEKMCQLTVTYTNDRVQFGRPVARFQAVQQHLVWAAQDAALVRMAAECAAREATRGGADFEIAAAKLIANQAAARATKACHQAHGAMGMTQEYPLHHYSRRLWSWRKEYGSDAHWSAVLGNMATGAGADGLYHLITDGSAALA